MRAIPEILQGVKWKASLGWGSVCMAMLMASLDTSIANTGLAAISDGLGGSFQMSQWVELAYLLAVTTMVVGAGRLGDAVGRKRAFVIGVAIFTLASLACGAASSMIGLIAARGVQGIGAALMLAMVLALGGEIAGRGKVGSAMGVVGAMSALGTTIGPALGGLLTGSVGWRWMFLVNVPVGSVVIVMAMLGIPDDEQVSGRSWRGFDIPGLIALATSLGGYCLAMTLTPFDAWSVGFVLIAILGAVWFVRLQRQSASPLIRMDVLWDQDVRSGLVGSVLVSMVMMATMVVGPIYLHREFGLSVREVGIAMSVGPLVAAGVSIPGGWMADRWGATRLSVIGLAGMGCGFGMLVLVPRECGVGGYLGGIVLVTAHYAMFQAGNTARVMGCSRFERGILAGLLSMARNIGLISGAAVLGSMLSMVVGTKMMQDASVESVRLGMHVVYAIAAAMLMIGVVMMRGRGDMRMRGSVKRFCGRGVC